MIETQSDQTHKLYKGAARKPPSFDSSFFSPCQEKGSHIDSNDVENCEFTQKSHNSNSGTYKRSKKIENFTDPIMAEVVNNLIDQTVRANSLGKTAKLPDSKLQKESNPFLMKNSLNSSSVSTSVSEDCNSCERSSADLSSKGRNSDSLVLEQSVNRKYSNPATNDARTLFRIPEQHPNELIHNMMQAAIISKDRYGYDKEYSPDSGSNSLNIKRPVPNKYKTEICRNWELEGF